MAEDVNFPLDQGRNASAFQALRENAQESGRSRRIEDEGEDLNNSDRVREQRPANELANLESRTEISSRARQRARKETAEDQTDVAEAERRELQANRQETSTDARTESRNPASQGAAGSNELARVSEGSAADPNPIEERARSGNDAADPDRIEEFERGDQTDSVQEVVTRAGERATSVEPENPATPLRGEPSIRDLGQEQGSQSQEGLEESFNADPPSPTERSEANLEQTPPTDARVQQRIQEERVAEEETRVRNEPALETPSQNIDQVEPPKEPLQEAVDNNPLRGPRPSELRDDDATAVETERGQNVSNLI